MFRLAIFISALSSLCASSAFAATYTAGTATVDVTPTTPIRLSGYGNRTEETTDIKQPLFVKALALRADAGPVALLLTLDNCAINLALSDEVCGRITAKTRVPRERIAINVSHTHCAPVLTNCIPNIFSKAIPAEHQAHIDAYTARVVEALVRAATDAVGAMQPAKLSFGMGSATFGANRRTPGGPSDHDLPVLCVKSPSGEVRALVAGYACHCTCLSDNVVNGDWAGFAQAAMQAAFPGAMGMVSVGCGGDQNPTPRGTLDHARRYGQEIADNVKQVVESGMREIDAPLACALKRVPLALDPAPSREEFETRAKEDTPRGYHARMQLAKLDRGEALRTEIPYTIQSWAFGDQLAMLFLAGEVVVDYATRFKIEYDRSRLWVSGYSNDVPCYIPSFRIREEGGYEGADAMLYYDQPARFAADVEDRIAAGVHELLPASYKNDHAKTNGFPPLRPYDALQAFVLPEGYEAKLAASEPLVQSPVALDFAPDGAIFVAEMYDYNIPPDQNDPPAGRIRRLVDTNGDGLFDKATIYLDHIPYPTGVTVWRNGILVCAAPDILFAEDTDGDGVADQRRVLFTGFSTNNFQARVNSLSFGLKGWMYGGGGLTGGRITRPDGSGDPVMLGGRDLRFNPDVLVFESETGQSQYGRARDDWGNWFGGDSSNLLKYYALPEEVLKRSPHLRPPATSVLLAGPPYQVYPASTTIERLNDPDDFNRITSACGLGIYRDDLLGPGFTGNAFACEPVHNLATRLVVEPKGASFIAHRAAGEEHSEFIASKDHWFRPAQVRTGPDGALWVVDMYRYVIEHEKWITPDRRESLDMFAGKNLGRIYRIKPKDAKLRPVQDLTKLATPDLVQALNTPNGTVRDLVQEMLLWHTDAAAIAPLRRLAAGAENPAVRVQAWALLEALDTIDANMLAAAAQDAAAPVRKIAAEIAPAVANAGVVLATLSKDPDAQVRIATGFALANWWKKEAGRLAGSMVADATDEYVITAALAGVGDRVEGAVDAYLAAEVQDLAATLPRFAGLAASAGEKDAARRLFNRAVKAEDFSLLQSVLDAVRGDYTAADLVQGANEDAFAVLLAHAGPLALDEAAPEAERAAALRLLGQAGTMDEAMQAVFAEVLTPQTPAAVQLAALKALAGREEDVVGAFLVRALQDLGPTERGVALDAVIHRASWCGALFDFITAHPEARQYLDASRKNFLQRHPDIDVRARAAAVLGDAATTARAEVVARYAEVEQLHGDAANGAKVFEERCGQCHQLESIGHAVGPDLSGLTDKSAHALIQAVLDPNEAVLEQYQAFTVETKDLRTLEGLIADESANSIALKMAGGAQETLLRADIERMSNTGKSLMPEGLEENLSPAQLADVVAFVQSNAPKPKQFKGNAPQPVLPAADGSYALTAENGAIYGGPEIEYRPRFGAIGGWAQPVDRAEWDIQAPAAGDYRVWMTWTSPKESDGAPWRIACGAAKLEGTLPSTGGWEDFEMHDMGAIHLETGTQTLVLQPTAPVAAGMMELRAITLKPAK